MQLSCSAVIALVVATSCLQAAESSFLNKHQVNLGSPAEKAEDISPEEEIRAEEISPEDEADGISPKDYEKAYDHLYDNHGYHADKDLTHEGSTIQRMFDYGAKLPAGAPPMHKVVVLGCSHGKGAEILHEHGYEVYGIDVAHKAIEMANKRERTCPGTDPCFVQGSLVKLPYDDASFDAGLSVDVLEHIAPEDVPQVVSEISRTVKRYLFVKIASFVELSKSGEKAGMTNVHLTTEHAPWWKHQFAMHGWTVTEDRSGPRYVNMVMEKM